VSVNQRSLIPDVVVKLYTFVLAGFMVLSAVGVCSSA
jgi:hypothetical protein